MSRILILISLTLSIYSCSKETDDVTSPNFGDITDAVFLSSFESNGISNLSGWQLNGELNPNLLSFSRDVPVGGGYWSLNLRGTQGSTAKVEIRSNTPLLTSDSLENYILTFWAKGKGQASLSINDSTAGWITYLPINTSSWAFFADTLNRHQSIFNKLEVWLNASLDDSLSSVYFDNVKVVRRKP